MTSRKLTTPFFSDPPVEYSRAYFAQLTRAFAQYVDVSRNPGEGRQTKLVLTDLQQGDTGLEDGTIYLDGNVLKVSQQDIAAPANAGISTSIGSVTVSTP